MRLARQLHLGGPQPRPGQAEGNGNAPSGPPACAESDPELELTQNASVPRALMVVRSDIIHTSNQSGGQNAVSEGCRRMNNKCIILLRNRCCFSVFRMFPWRFTVAQRRQPSSQDHNRPDEHKDPHL